jgi:peptide/nickel transport system permease protein
MMALARFPFEVLVGALGLVLLLVVVLGGPLFIPHDPLAMHLEHQLQPPSHTYWLGTDLFGRDVFTRLIYGGRISLRVGVVSVGIALLPGLIMGLLAGYYGRVIDTLFMRLTDVMLAFPSLLLALSIVALLGPSLTNAMIAIGIGGVPRYTRLVRANVLAIRETSFVEAAVATGCKSSRIILLHILPNILGPVVALTTLDVGLAILNVSGLSFLGLGAQPPTPEWGLILSEGRGYILQAPWMALAPGLMIFLTVLSINLIGDGLRHALDSKKVE